MKSIKMKKIKQFRDIVSTINRTANFVGLDGNGEAIYDNTKPKPTLTFKGTTKLHGTNASVCLHKDEIYAQKKSGKITIEKDNFGFAFFVESNKDHFKEILKEIAKRANVNTDENILTYYGEWAGNGIQKAVAISNMEKSFFGFGVKITPITNSEDDEQNSYWLDSDIFGDLSATDRRIYNLYMFKTFDVEVNFESPLTLGKAQELFEKLTLEVEAECPVAKELGHKGIGEGIVWTCEYNGSYLMFKTKGDKHSVSKVKKVASIDVEKLKSIEEFVQYASTKNRFEQAIGEIFPNEEPVINKMGDLIRWVVNDINSEETDTLVENGLEPRDVNKYISKDVRDRFMKYLDELQFGK